MSAARRVAGAPDDPSALLLDTFVALADTLASDYEVGDFLQFLVDRCSELLLADTVGVLLETPAGTLALAAATSPEMLEIKDLEMSLGQGPGLEAYRTGRQVTAADLGQCRDRWPQFVDRIGELGMRSAYAFPLRLRDDSIGALNLYWSVVEAVSPREISLGQALADSAAVGILQERAVFEAERRSEQLQRALDSRIVIEQAKGMLAERRGLRPGEAFTLLRTHARSNNLKLREVCRLLLDGELEL